jgi:hypothetical protein
MPKNPMLRAALNKVNVPGMPKPPGMGKVTNPVKAERVQRSAAGSKKMLNPRAEGKIE